ncbi:EB module [Dictyocaulus viviparus]|uniref:EB module n=1 Tax=Dictyocaulus viviparus TaxID=29172 RepID=A0A0D8Y6Y6_DICVI|nr:EB module [Dictyocaulus viviparus]
MEKMESFVCKSNEVLIGDQCYSLVKINGRCMFNEQCLGGSVCHSNVCRCPQNTFNNGDGRKTLTSTNEQSLRLGSTSLCASTTEDVVYETSSMIPINCLMDRCPYGSYCHLNKRLQRYFCCKQKQDGSGDTERCSNPLQSVVYENGNAINCLLTRCPTNSRCEYSSTAQHRNTTGRTFQFSLIVIRGYR